MAHPQCPYLLDEDEIAPFGNSKRWLYKYRLRDFARHLGCLATSDVEEDEDTYGHENKSEVPERVDRVEFRVEEKKVTAAYNALMDKTGSEGHIESLMRKYQEEFLQIQLMHFIDAGEMAGKIEHCATKGHRFYIGKTGRLSGYLWKTMPKGESEKGRIQGRWQSFCKSIDGYPEKLNTYYCEPSDQISEATLLGKYLEGEKCVNGRSEPIGLVYLLEIQDDENYVPEPADADINSDLNKAFKKMQKRVREQKINIQEQLSHLEGPLWDFQRRPHDREILKKLKKRVNEMQDSLEAIVEQQQRLQTKLKEFKSAAVEHHKEVVAFFDSL